MPNRKQNPVMNIIIQVIQKMIMIRAAHHDMMQIQVVMQRVVWGLSRAKMRHEIFIAANSLVN